MKNICQAIGIICVLSSSLVAMESSKSDISISKHKPFHVSGNKTMEDLYREFNPSEETKYIIYNQVVQQLDTIRSKRQLPNDLTLFSRFINMHLDDPDKIKTVRKQAFLLIHPDKFLDNNKLSTKAFQNLKELFEQYKNRQGRFLEFVQNHKKACKDNENKVGTLHLLTLSVVSLAPEVLKSHSAFSFGMILASEIIKQIARIVMQVVTGNTMKDIMILKSCENDFDLIYLLSQTAKTPKEELRIKEMLTKIHKR